MVTRKFVSVKEAVTITGLSMSTLWRLERGGKFVQKRRLSSSRVAYCIEELTAWCQSRSTVVSAKSIP